MDFDVIVIGEGVAGLTAAGEIASKGHRVATLEAQLFGGLIININELDPAPAGSTGGGAEFASSLVESAANAGVESINEPVTGIERLVRFVRRGNVEEDSIARRLAGARIAAVAAVQHQNRLESVILGGLGIHLVEGEGLPPGIADALFAKV